MIISRFVQACFLMLALSLPVAAVTSNWNTNTGGSFIDATKWSAGVPLVNDTAVFNRNLDIEYGVTFPGRPILSPLTREVRQLIVGTNTVSFSDSVNFNQLPANFAIDAANTLAEGALIIGNSAGQVGELNTTLSNFSTSSVIVGNTELFPLTAVGTLNVNGGTFNVTGSQQLGDELVIGNEGNGLLYITGGADVNVTGGPHANAVFGRSSRELFGGYASVDGNGSTLNIGGELILGEDGFGTLIVQQGGQVTTGSAVLGKLSMFGGAISRVEGIGSTWTNQGEIAIGREGEASFSIISGGVVTTSGNAYAGEFSGSNGFVTILGAGSTWTIGGNLVLGNSGAGSSNVLRVVNGSSVSVAGLLTVESNGIIESNSNISADITNGGIVDTGSDAYNTVGALQLDGSYTQTAAGKLKVDLGGTLPATDYEQLLVSGAVSLNGTLEVLLNSPFIPAVGDAFNIIDGASIIGTFNTLLLPTLPSGASWNTTQLYSTGTLLVTVAGDFDADGDVDGRDFLLWQRGGSLNPFSAGDLADWQANYGVGSLTASSVAVPETATISMLLIACSALFLRWQNLKDNWLSLLILFLLVFSSTSTMQAAFPLQNATATFSQTSFGGQPVGQAIDGSLGNQNGWAIYEGPTDCCGAIPGNTNPQIAVFETASDISVSGGASLTFTLQHLFYIGTHGLGRFRLSATTDSRSTFADGLASGGDVSAAWTELAPITANATTGATLSILGDKSILAGGANPGTSTYTVTAFTPLVGITGFRLEVLADGSFSDSGPGRNSNGNFVLTEFQVDANILLGDFDADGDVDGRDFLLWQRGGSPTPFSAGDLADWQAEYNGGLLSALRLPPSALNNAVPEPGALILLLGGLVVIGRVRIGASQFGPR